jgi:succinoglycan biosynthesis protein ExoO
MPARNAARYVERAVRSVVDSQGVALSLLVVDDASTDATPVILRHLQAEYPDCLHVERTSVQVGANAARNLALAHVNGAFVGFVDADDYIIPDRFAVMLDLARGTGSEFLLDDLVFVREGADVGRLFSDRGAKELCRSRVRELSLSEFVRHDLGVGQPLVAARVATQVVFPTDVRHTGDFEYFFRCLSVARLAHTTSHAGYWYRRHEGVDDRWLVRTHGR